MFLVLKLNSCKRMNNSRVSLFLLLSLNMIRSMVLQSSFIISGDVELDPEPKRISSNDFSICHLNLNSISAHNYAKGFLLKAYFAIHQFDIICISETLILVLLLMITI